MCDTMAVVGDGRVLFAKNSDREPNEGQFLDWHPRQAFATGERLRCTWVEIPQARQTYAVLLSRPFWMWGAEIGTNEFGVTIGNEAVFTRQRYAKSGLTGMDLLRLALERSATAAGAVQTIVSLLEEFGQGGGCKLADPGFTYHNSYIVADPRTAFVLETAGRHHAVEEIRGARSISNGLTIPGFAERHSDTIKTYVSACRLRRARTQPLAERARGPADLAAALRDHGTEDGLPKYSWLNGGLCAVRACRRTAGRFADHGLVGRRVAAGQRAALGHGHRGAVHGFVQAGHGRLPARHRPHAERLRGRRIAVVAARAIAPRGAARSWTARDPLCCPARRARTAMVRRSARFGGSVCRRGPVAGALDGGRAQPTGSGCAAWFCAAVLEAAECRGRSAPGARGARGGVRSELGLVLRGP